MCSSTRYSCSYDIEANFSDSYCLWDSSFFKWFYSLSKRKQPMNSQISSTVKKIQEKLKTVYDPEFPMIDLYTL